MRQLPFASSGAMRQRSLAMARDLELPLVDDCVPQYLNCVCMYACCAACMYKYFSLPVAGSYSTDPPAFAPRARRSLAALRQRCGCSQSLVVTTAVLRKMVCPM